MLRVARTIADLAGKSTIAPAHVAAAIQHRALDRSRQYHPGSGPVPRYRPNADDRAASGHVDRSTFRDPGDRQASLRM